MERELQEFLSVSHLDRRPIIEKYKMLQFRLREIQNCQHAKRSGLLFGSWKVIRNQGQQDIS